MKPPVAKIKSILKRHGITVRFNQDLMANAIVSDLYDYFSPEVQKDFFIKMEETENTNQGQKKRGFKNKKNRRIENAEASTRDVATSQT